MKKIAVLTIMLALSAGLSFGKEHRTAIAIMNITATSGITLAEATQLTKKLLNELVLRDVYDIVDLDKRDEILKEQGFQQTGACDETSCLVEAGKLLGVKKIIGGCIGEIGSVYSVELQLVDVLTGKVEKVYSDQCSGDPARLLSLMKESSYTISGINMPSNSVVLPITPSRDVPTSPKSRLNWNGLPRGTIDLSNGLAAFFPFNGNANDESGNKRHGTTFGTVLTSDRFGRPGQAYFFNGMDNYIRLAKASDLGITNNSLSISVWFNVKSFQSQNHGDQAVIANDIYSQNGGCLHLVIRSGGAQYRQPFFNFYNDGANDPSETKIEPNQWYHVVAVYDKEKRTKYMYINGQFDTELSGCISYTGIDYLNAGRYAGGHNSLGNNYFTGIIDDVRIYDRVLNSDEITELFKEK